MSPAELHAIARDPARDPLTRRAASEALDALDAVRVRLAVDAGAPMHQRPDEGGVRVVLGPVPVPADGGAMPSFSLSPSVMR